MTKEIKTPWVLAVDEELVVTHLGIANEDDDLETAQRKLSSLINWHVDVALDPAVNGGSMLVSEDNFRLILQLAKACQDDIRQEHFVQASLSAQNIADVIDHIYFQPRAKYNSVEQEPEAELAEQSTHDVYRREGSTPCFCYAEVDHLVGQEKMYGED